MARVISRWLLCGVLAATVAAATEPAAPARQGEVQQSPADTTVAPPEAESPGWGPPSGGLSISLSLDGDVSSGGNLKVSVSLKSAAGNPVALPPAKDVFGWLLVAQSTPGSKKAYYSEKISFAGAGKDWPAEIGGDKMVTYKSIDLSKSAAYASEDAKRLLTAYVSQAGEGLPKPAGKMSAVLMPGRAMAKFTLCIPATGAAPTLVTSAAAEILVGPPDFKSLSPEARQAFIVDLLKQYDRDAWSGQQAHDTAVRLGKDVLDAIIPPALQTRRPSHARLWLATTLADIADERAVNALIKLLDDPMGGVRYVAAYHGVKQRDARLDKAIIDKVQSSKDAGLATWALQGFMVFRGSAPDELVKATLESDDPKARVIAAEMLAKHAGDTNVGRLAALLADKDERVRSTAATMLAKYKSRTPAVIAGLVKALDKPGENARLRVCAALSELTGRSGPYDPAADQAARDKTLADWRAWFEKQSAK